MADRPQVRALVPVLLAVAWVASAAAPGCRAEGCGRAPSRAEDCCSGHACCEMSADDCGTTSQAGSPDDCCGTLSRRAATTLGKTPPLPFLDLAPRQASLELPTASPLHQDHPARDPAPPPDDGLYTLHASLLI